MTAPSRDARCNRKEEVDEGDGEDDGTFGIYKGNYNHEKGADTRVN